MRANKACREGQYDEAVRLIEPALSAANPPMAVLSCLGIAYFRTGEFQKSVQCWETAIKQNPRREIKGALDGNLARAAYAAAKAEAARGSFKQAARYLETFCLKNRGDAEAKVLLERVRKIIRIEEAKAEVASARDHAGAGRWSEAAEQLLSAREKIASFEPPSPPASRAHGSV